MTQRMDQTPTTVSRGSKISSSKVETIKSTGKKSKTTAASAVKKTLAPANDARAAIENLFASLSDDERRRMIAETAYFRAQNRGFANGNDVEDWLLAESEVNARFPQ